MGFAAILVAAGAGDRLGADRPKALVEVASLPLVTHAAQRLLEAGAVHLVVTAPRGHVPEMIGAMPDTDVPIDVVTGGATRAASVRAGLVALDPSADLVAVHDAARAFAPADLIRATVAAVTGDVVAAAPGLPVTDTIKRVDGSTVVATIDRDGLVAVQTPQVFRRDVLLDAHADASDATDDLALVERRLASRPGAGTATGRVAIVPGVPEAMKVTHAHDLHVVAAMVAGDRP